jgi:hypothetical protein
MPMTDITAAPNRRPTYDASLQREKQSGQKAPWWGSSFLMLGHCKFGVPVPVERLAIGVSIVVGADHVCKSNIDQNATRERLRCG